MGAPLSRQLHGAACCLSDLRSGVIFAVTVVVVSQQKQQWGVVVSVQEGLRLCVLQGARWSDRPRDVIPWSANGGAPL